MPSYENADLLLTRISNCNQELDRFFINQSLNFTIRSQLKQIKAFYLLEFNNTSNEETGESIVNQYEEFIIAISEVQLGQIKAEEAHKKIQDKTEESQIDIVIYNILTVCELLFWTTVAATSYAACLAIGIPLLFLEPLVGFAVTAGTCVLCLISLNGADDCFDDFKTFDRINAENTREKAVISFFSPNPPTKTTLRESTDTEELQQQLFVSN